MGSVRVEACDPGSTGSGAQGWGCGGARGGAHTLIYASLPVGGSGVPVPLITSFQSKPVTQAVSRFSEFCELL